MRNSVLRAGVILFSVFVISFFTGVQFRQMRQSEPIYPSPFLRKIGHLSDYLADLKGSYGDSEIYFFQGDSAGGTTLILGGTHPNEPAGFIAAVILIENLKVTRGRIIVIPWANNSGFTHNDPQEGSPQRFFIPTKRGDRWFRYGSRVTNPIDQWPDPEVYLHFPSRQKLSGAETRNLNRSYPGRPNGTLTEKVAFAIMELMRKEQVDLAFDLHEASLEYPVINAIVAHPLAADLAAEAVLYLQMDGINISLEPSPENFHGLSHREWGDHLKIPTILMETANPLQGRYHGRVTDDIILTGKDKFNLEAAQNGLLEVEYPEEGIPLKVRVGRHIHCLQKILSLWNVHNPDKAIGFANLPDYSAFVENGVGAFLHSPDKINDGH